MKNYFERKIPKERWVPLMFCQGKYHVSTFGRVKSVYTISKKGFIRLTGTILKTTINHKGYEKVRLSWFENGVEFKKTLAVHRLVGFAFHPNPENKPEINYKDLNKLNNYYLNLEWATSLENKHHAQRMGACPIAKPKLKHDRIVKCKEIINTITGELLNTMSLAERLKVPRRNINRVLGEERKPNLTPYRYTGRYVTFK